MDSFTVNLGERSYPIFFTYDRMEETADLFRKEFPGSRLFFVTNDTIAGLYQDKIRKILEAKHCDFHFISLPDGDDYKNLTTAEQIFSQLIRNGADRRSVIVGFGGGVIGDIAGFAASAYMRGVPFVQFPTTLLAMVDSSVGGKVAVNHALGKNMIGAFYQPKWVAVDYVFLETLPKRESICGLAEMIKYGLILDKTFFDWIVAHTQDILSLERAAIDFAVKRSCELKAQVVEKDEKENDIRIVLNFGHTWAHAFENLGGYRTIKHGEAVLLGLLAASHMSWINYRLNDAEFKQIEQALLPLIKQILANADVRRFLTSLSWDAVWNTMQSDKKANARQIRWVMLNCIGEAATDDQLQPSLAEKSFVYLQTLIQKTDHV